MPLSTFSYTNHRIHSAAEDLSQWAASWASEMRSALNWRQLLSFDILFNPATERLTADAYGSLLASWVWQCIRSQRLNIGHNVVLRGVL